MRRYSPPDRSYYYTGVSRFVRLLVGALTLIYSSLTYKSLLYDAFIFKVVTPQTQRLYEVLQLDDACIFKVVTPACTLASGVALTIRPISWPVDILTNLLQRYEINLKSTNIIRII